MRVFPVGVEHALDATVQRPRNRPISANEKTPPHLDGVKFGRRRHRSPMRRQMDHAMIRRYFRHEISLDEALKRGWLVTMLWAVFRWANGECHGTLTEFA